MNGFARIPAGTWVGDTTLARLAYLGRIAEREARTAGGPNARPHPEVVAFLEHADTVRRGLMAHGATSDVASDVADRCAGGTIAHVPPSGPPARRTRAHSVAEAAEVLGVGVAAVTARLRRGTLEGTQDRPGGPWTVYLPEEQTS